MSRNENILKAIGNSYFLLQQEKEIKLAIEKILGVLGEATEVDRVYIFKNIKSKSGEKKFTYAFEWVAEGITPILHLPLLKDLPFDLFPEVFNPLSQNQIINELVENSSNKVFMKTMQEQNILAFLFIPIFTGNFFWGWIGFDNCKTSAKFSETETAGLHALATTIGTRIQNLVQKKKVWRQRKNYEKVIDSLDSVIFYLDSRGKIIFVSRSWRDLSGYALYNTVNQDFTLFFSKENTKAILTKLDSLSIKKSENNPLELELLNAKKERVWVRVSFSKFNKENRSLGETLVTVTSIHNEKIANIETEKLNLLLETINESQLRFFEQEDIFEPLESVLKSLLKLTHSEFGFMAEVFYDEQGNPYFKTNTITNISWSEEVEEFYQSNFRNGMEFRNLNSLFGEILKSENLVISNDCTNDPRRSGIPKGHPILKRFMGIPVHKNGEFLGAIGIANKSIDYSEADMEFLKPIISSYANFIKALRVNKQRKETENLYKLLSENTDDILALHDFDLKFKYISPSFEKILGYKPDEVLGKAPNDLFKEKPIRIEKNNKFHKMIIPHWHKSGKNLIILEIFLKQLLDKDGNAIGILATSRDVTDRENALIKLKKSLSNQRELNRLKSRFVSMASHELRTPLSTIISSTELLELITVKIKDPNIKSKIDVHLNRIGSQTNRLKKIISDILIIEENSRGDIEFNYEKIYIRKFVYDLVNENFNFNGDKKINLELPEKDMLIDSEISWLQHIIKNIIENAIKYSGGSSKTPILRLKYLKDFILIEIEDYGIGIPEEDKKLIFNSFFRARNVSNIKGTGLGLNIVKDFLNKLGGNIKFISKEGIGTKFIIKIPYENQNSIN